MRRAGGLTVWLLLLLAARGGVAHAVPQAPRVFAIVIGNNQPPEPGPPALRYADDDAVMTDVLLHEAGVFSLALVRLDAVSREVHASWRPYGLPRSADFLRARELIRAKMRQAQAEGAAVELMLFYSGHGDVEHGEGYLALEDQHLTRSLLYELLADIGASRSHVIIDACKSYFMAYARGEKRVRFAGAVKAPVPAGLRNTGFILSTSSDRESHEWERYEGGILSHELHSALRGAADVNLDGQVSYEELTSFLTTVNGAIKNPRFRPDILVRAPEDDFTRTFLRWPLDRRPLAVEPAGWDHFFVESSAGDRLLDAHPAPGQVLHLRVPEERPLFIRRNDGTGEQVVGLRGAMRVGEPAPSNTDVGARGSAYGYAYQSLFELPFGARDVRSFRGAALREVTIDDAQRPPPLEAAPALRLATAVIALTGLIAGASLSAVAIANLVGSADASQRDIARANSRIEALHLASIPCYAVGVIGAAVWAWPSLWRASPATEVDVSMVAGQARQPGGIALRLRQRF